MQSALEQFHSTEHSDPGQEANNIIYSDTLMFDSCLIETLESEQQLKTDQSHQTLQGLVKNDDELDSAAEIVHSYDLSRLLCTVIPQKNLTVKPRKVGFIDGSLNNKSDVPNSEITHHDNSIAEAESGSIVYFRAEDDSARQIHVGKTVLADSPKNIIGTLPLIANNPKHSLSAASRTSISFPTGNSSISEDTEPNDKEPKWWARTPSDVSDSRSRRPSLTQDQIQKIVGKNSKLKHYYFGHSFEDSVADESVVKQRETFFSKLYDIVACEMHSNCVDWAQDGKSIVFTDPYTFQNTVIPHYFPGTWRSNCGALLGKACDFSEIVRILRSHNFKKCDPADPDSQEYMHSLFVRGFKENTFKIRKRSTGRIWKFPSPACEVIDFKEIDSCSKSLQKLPPQQTASKQLSSANVSAKDDKIRTCIKQLSANIGPKSKMSVSDIVFQLQKHKLDPTHASLKQKQGPSLKKSDDILKQPSAFLKKLREPGQLNDRLVGVGHVIPERGMRVKLSFAGIEHKMTLGVQPRSTLVLLRGTIDDMESDCGMCKVKWLTGDEDFCCTGFCGKFYLEACALDKQSTDAKWWCQQALLAPGWAAAESDSIWRLGKIGTGRVRQESRSLHTSRRDTKSLGVLEGAREEVNQHFNRLRAEEARREEEQRATLRRRRGVDSPANPPPPPVATQIAGGSTSGSAAEDVGTFFRARGTLAEVVERGEMAALERLLRRTYDSMDPQPSGHVAVREIMFCINRMRVGATKVAMKTVMAEHDGGEDELSYGGFLDLMYDLLSRCKVAPTATMRRRSIAPTW
uniref:HSF-type DNA-binding domain-containing protein n=1 Tax=Cryptomonas curvata TaxID=233186 RepID=A0A7S0LZN3_9CRYP